MPPGISTNTYVHIIYGQRRVIAAPQWRSHKPRTLRD